jgi:UDP-N-acetylglucosamine acyltransferase
MSIHPTAVVSPGARIGAGVSIGAFTVVEDGVEIGDGCRIGPHVSLLRYTKLGANCRVHDGAVLGDLPQDLAFKDAVSFVEIGPGTTIREHVTVHRGTKENTVTRTGADCFLMANSHLAHNVQLGRRVILANGVLLAGYVEVGDGAFLSGNLAVHQFVRMGRLAMAGGGGTITKDVPPFCMTANSAYNRLVGLNSVGLRRAGMPADERMALRRAFRSLFLQRVSVRAAAQELIRENREGPVREIADFILSSKRGICAHRGRDRLPDDESPDA